MGSNLKLNIQLESMRKKLDRAHQRQQDLIDERDRLKRAGAHHLLHGSSLDPGHVEVRPRCSFAGGHNLRRSAEPAPRTPQAMRQALVSAIAALQAFGLALPPPPPAPSSFSSSTTSTTEKRELVDPRKPLNPLRPRALEADSSPCFTDSPLWTVVSATPGSPPCSPFTAGFDSPDQASATAAASSAAAATATSRRSSLAAARGSRQSMCTLPPDLSNISEADATDEEREEQRMRDHESEAFRMLAWRRQQQQLQPDSDL